MPVVQASSAALLSGLLCLAQSASIREIEVRIGKAPWELPGTLTLPQGRGPFPLAVLGHDSGPQDRDETAGPRKPFRDLASGLAARGIAVLRYDKRSWALRIAFEALPRYTVREECLQDAAQAVHLAKSLPMIDPKRIYVLGHGLAGYLLPRLAQAVPDAAGYAALAAPTRAPEVLMLEQLHHRGAPSLFRSKIEADIERIQQLSPSVNPTEILLNAPASYWLDLKGYDPAREASRLLKPLFLGYGDQDPQMTREDIERWLAFLGARRNVRMKRYPGLDHGFMRAQATGGGAPRVDEGVIEDLAAWMQER